LLRPRQAHSADGRSAAPAPATSEFGLNPSSVFGLATILAFLTFPVFAQTPAGVPSLDEMAGDWLPMKDVANPPDVNNFHDMLIINRDLTSFFCNPEDWLWGWGDGKWGPVLI